MEILLDERRILFLGLITAVFMGSIAYSFLLPKLAVANVLKTTEVTGYSIHERDVEHRHAVLIINIVVGNPSAISVTVTEITANVTVDSKDYDCLSTSGTTGTIKPHNSKLFQKFVQLRDSPLSWEEIPLEPHEVYITVELTCIGRTPLSKSIKTGRVHLNSTWPQLG